ncbi:MAG: MOSC domain-containing protein [Planctomycetales bacterium]
MQTIAELKSSFPRAGRVEWIGVARERGGAVDALSEVVVRPGTGIDGEHHAASGNSKRQVTLIQHEHLAAIAALLGDNRADKDVCPTVEPVEPRLLRRNVVVSGINLLALKDRRFRIGEALLEGTGPCAPCSRMEHNLGPGGFNAMRGHGGITAIVIEGGTVRVGDAVSHALDREAPSP